MNYLSHLDNDHAAALAMNASLDIRHEVTSTLRNILLLAENWHPRPTAAELAEEMTRMLCYAALLKTRR